MFANDASRSVTGSHKSYNIERNGALRRRHQRRSSLLDGSDCRKYYNMKTQNPSILPIPNWTFGASNITHNMRDQGPSTSNKTKGHRNEEHRPLEDGVFVVMIAVTKRITRYQWVWRCAGCISPPGGCYSRSPVLFLSFRTYGPGKVDVATVETLTTGGNGVYCMHVLIYFWLWSVLSFANISRDRR